MSDQNPFKQLEQEVTNQYGPLPPRIGKNLHRNVSLFRFWGDIVEVYFPKVLKLFITATRGTDAEHKQSHRNPPNTI